MRNRGMLGFHGVPLDPFKQPTRKSSHLRLGWLVPEVAANPWIEVCGPKKWGTYRDIPEPDGSELPNNHLG